MIDLKPCPFCGDENVDLLTESYGDGYSWQNTEDHHVYCHCCDAQSGSHIDPVLAADKWNQRAVFTENSLGNE